MKKHICTIAVLIGTLLLAWPLWNAGQKEQRLRHPVAAHRATKSKKTASRKHKMPITLYNAYAVTGAGTTAYNGNYVYLGSTNDSEKVFVLGGAYALWFSSGGGEWILSPLADVGNPSNAAYHFSSATDPASDTWFGVDSGSAPPPGVAEGVATPPPGVALAPTLTAISSTAIDVTTPAFPSDTTSFSIDRSPHSANTWSEIATGKGAATLFHDTGLSNHTQYDYRVRAIGDGGETAGATGSATTLMATPGNANLKLYFPYSVSAIPLSTVSGTGAVMTGITDGTEAATTIVPAVDVQGRATGPVYNVVDDDLIQDAVDEGITTDKGGTAQIHCLYIEDGTDAAWRLMHAPDDTGAPDTGAAAELCAFTTISAVGGEQIEVAAGTDIEQWVWAERTDSTGECVVAIVWNRNI